ncbi:MAG: prolyl oligopeptidase family serine peptidase [Bryobacteraceae bacterium]
MTKLSLISLRVFCACLFISFIQAQEPSVGPILKQLEQVRAISGVTISPDGGKVAWIITTPDGKGNDVYLLDLKSGAPKLIQAGNSDGVHQNAGIRWSPDSRVIAFLSDAGSPSQQQVYLYAVGEGKAQRVTSLKGYVTDIRWSPDGKQLAFLYAEGGGGGGPLEAEPAQTGAIGSDVHNQRLTIIGATGGNMRQVSPAELNIYEYDWAPDGTRFAALAAPGPADNNWWIAQLYTVAVNSGQMTPLYRPPVDRQLAVPRWSPDGEQIAFLGGIMSDQGFNGGDLFVINSSGGEPRNMTSGRKASPSGLSWQSSTHIIFTETVDGHGAISTLDVNRGQRETIWQGNEGVHQDGNFPNFSLAKDGRTSAIVRSSWERAPEVWAGPIGEWRQLTRVNADQKPHWGKAESVIWQNEGFRMQGWLLYPEHYDPAQRYPMVTEIHGGPAGSVTPAWPSARFDMSVLASLGYFVFFPNPRGSYGEGEAFTRANVKDFGGGDLRDILAGVDQVIKQAPVDSNRLGVTGWSYGGFMTMWTVTQTNRFRAAVAGAGIANWQSYYGQNSIDEWMIPYFGASVYDDPAVYAKSSPITFIKQVKTPTLVVVGERDGECPAPQSFEFWHALKSQKVPTQLVVYPGEGHGFHEPKNRLDVLRRTIEWFSAYLRENSPAQSATALK